MKTIIKNKNTKKMKKNEKYFSKKNNVKPFLNLHSTHFNNDCRSLHIVLGYNYILDLEFNTIIINLCYLLTYSLTP